MHWRTARRTLSVDRPLVMGILNVTPDSFSDGGRWSDEEAATACAESMIAEGADIIDVGGQSTRPGSTPVDPDVELKRTLPIVAAIAKRFDTPISIDTFHWLVAKAGLDHGAEIINDISGLRWDARLADVAVKASAGMVLMHSRGSFETMHTIEPAHDILADVTNGLRASIETAKKWGVADSQIVLDPGIGFGKTFEQNLELLAKLGMLVDEFENYPILIGTSRKSFLGKILDGAPPSERLGGSLASALLAVSHGAKILRVHDVKETVSAIRVLRAIHQ
jgi:dihydropteroate synthase